VVSRSRDALLSFVGISYILYFYLCFLSSDLVDYVEYKRASPLSIAPQLLPRNTEVSHLCLVSFLVLTSYLACFYIRY